MKKLLTILSLFASAALPAQPLLKYSFSADTSLPAARFGATLAFKGNASGETRIQLPEEFGNQKKLYLAIKKLEVITKGVKLDTTDNPAVRVLRHRPGASIRLRYTLEQDWQGKGLTHPENFRAVINKQYLHFTGNSLLVYPKWEDSSRIRVVLDWSGLPANWAVANSLHSMTRKYEGSIQLGKFVNSIYMAGDYRLYRALIRNQPVYLAIRGEGWKFADSSLLIAVEKIIGIQRAFWNDHTEPYFLVTMSPFIGQGSYNGSALHQGFMTCATTEFGLDHGLLGLISHEYFHRWAGGLIQPKGIEDEHKWLTEGFTEYYTYKLLYKGGLVNFAQWMEAVNRSISDYYLSADRNADRVTMGKNYWANRSYHMLPYKKGFVYALYLDALAAANGFSLDEIMFALGESARKNEDITDSLFIALVNRYTARDMSSEHHAYINEGKTIPVISSALGENAGYAILELGVFDPGFDPDESGRLKVVTGVKPASEAWKAGLRDGQQLKSWSIHYDDITKPIELVLKEEDGKERKLSYFPISTQKVEVPQFHSLR